MRIIMVTDKDEVIDILEKVEEYDLSKPLAAATLIAIVAEAIRYDKVQTARELYKEEILVKHKIGDIVKVIEDSEADALHETSDYLGKTGIVRGIEPGELYVSFLNADFNTLDFVESGIKDAYLDDGYPGRHLAWFCHDELEPVVVEE